jgi:hypothetical protein
MVQYSGVKRLLNAKCRASVGIPKHGKCGGEESYPGRSPYEVLVPTRRLLNVNPIVESLLKAPAGLIHECAAPCHDQIDTEYTLKIKIQSEYSSSNWRDESR